MGDVGHSTEGAVGDSLTTKADVEASAIGDSPLSGEKTASPSVVQRDVSGVFARSALGVAADDNDGTRQRALGASPAIPAVVVVRWGGSAEVRVLRPGDHIVIDTGGAAERLLSDRIGSALQSGSNPGEPSMVRRKLSGASNEADAFASSVQDRSAQPESASKVFRASQRSGHDKRASSPSSGVRVECEAGARIRVWWIAPGNQLRGAQEVVGDPLAAETSAGLGLGRGNGDVALMKPDGLLLEPGEELQLGSLALAAVPWAPEESGRLRVLSHDAFVARVREELARRGRPLHGGTLALVQLRQVRREQETLRDLLKLRPGDVVGAFAASVLEFYLPETTESEAGAIIDRVFERNRVIKTSCAAHPARGNDLDSLLAAALAGLRGDEGRRFGGHFIATDMRMSRLVEKAEELAKSSLPVLIEGEPGAGKRSLAHAVHAKVFGQGAEWVEVQGLAGLVEFERALRGDIEPSLVLIDPHLLPPLEQSMIARRLSLSAAPKWVACLLSESLGELVSRKRIDGELASLIASFTCLSIPALRQRPMDLIPIAMSSLERLAPGSSHRLSVSAMAHLATHDWPGNVRELQVVLDRALRLAGQGSIHIEHLPIGEVSSEASAPVVRGQARLKQHVDSLERHAIEQAMADANFNQTHAARRLGISRRALIYKLEKYGLKAHSGSIRPGRAAG